MEQPVCRVCGEPIGQDKRPTFDCPGCRTPHHKECWDYSGGCAIFGCEHAGRSASAPDLKKPPIPLLDTPSPRPGYGLLALLVCSVLSGVIGIWWGSQTGVRPPAESVPPRVAIASPSEEPLCVGGVTVKGHLLFDSRPVTAWTSVPARLWLRNELTGRVQGARMKVEGDRFEIAGLPARGRFGLSVTVDANRANPAGYPADYEIFQRFDLTTDPPPELVVPVAKVFHLLAPEDNGHILPDWSPACDRHPELASPVRFAWEPLDKGVAYSWSIQRVACDFSWFKVVAGEKTAAAEVRVPLPPSGPQEFYMFSLTAHRGAVRVGILTTHGDRGKGWDYRFRVRP